MRLHELLAGRPGQLPVPMYARSSTTPSSRKLAATWSVGSGSARRFCSAPRSGCWHSHDVLHVPRSLPERLGDRTLIMALLGLGSSLGCCAVSHVACGRESQDRARRDDLPGNRGRTRAVQLRCRSTWLCRSNLPKSMAGLDAANLRLYLVRTARLGQRRHTTDAVSVFLVIAAGLS